jgi:hypothetical protein
VLSHEEEPLTAREPSRRLRTAAVLMMQIDAKAFQQSHAEQTACGANGRDTAIVKLSTSRNVSISCFLAQHAGFR